MKKAVLLFFAVTIRLSCYAQQPANRETHVFMHDLLGDYYENFINPAVFANSATIFTAPDTAAAVLYRVPFRTPVKILQRGSGRTSAKKAAAGAHVSQGWYKVELRDKRTGYIPQADVAEHVLSDPGYKNEYFLFPGFVGPGNTYNLMIYKYSKAEKKFTDSLLVSLPGEASYRAQELSCLGWKNTSMLFRFTAIQAYCGGGTTEIFILDAGGKLSELTRSFCGGEQGDVSCTTTWLPVTFPAGKVILVVNGDLDNILDRNSGNLNTFPVPKSITAKPSELIVVKIYETVSVLDEAGNAIETESGSYKSVVTKNVTHYYRWDGYKMVKLK